jgi:putative DNA primase/helicase
MTFAAEVLMESRGERHPTELAQFAGVRLALTSEPASESAWNDSRVKHLTGDAEISARVMRGDFFTFPRTHKTVVIGNHMPTLRTVTHAIKRRVQMVPFRAVFKPQPGVGMRERLKSEAAGAILAWIVEGARLWRQAGTCPPPAVADLTAEYISDQDAIGQWIEARCARDAQASEQSSILYQDFARWSECEGAHARSNKWFAAQLLAAGFRRVKSMGLMLFYGLQLREGEEGSPISDVSRAQARAHTHVHG